jgi:manganese oxidase
VIHAFAGDPVKIHVVSAWSEQAQVFGVEGHTWSVEPAMPGARQVSSAAIAGLETLTLDLLGGAGGHDAAPGDYRYGAERGPYFEAGMWGVLRVLPRGSDDPSIAPLPVAAERSGWPLWPAVPAGLLLLGVVLLGVVRSRRRRAVASTP